jgi:hypothetical protein
MSKPIEDCTISTTDDGGNLYTIRVSGDEIEVSRRGETWTGAIVYHGERMIGVEWSEGEGEPEPDADEIGMVEMIITEP